MKNVFHLKSTMVFFISFLFLSVNSEAQQNNNQTTKKTSEWYNNLDWLNGLKLKPHKSIDQIEFTRQYLANKALWDKAFEYLRVTDLKNIKPGTFAIDGKNVYVIVTEGPGKDFEQGKWESHRHYNDIQYVIKGKEWIGIAPVTSLTVTEAYDNSKDVAFHKGKGKYYIGDSEEFFIFFPRDAHRPGIKVNCNEPIKKIVIKVATGT